MAKKYSKQALEQLQQVEREILDVCVDVCDRLGIESVLIDSGTCLGAVRHKGFIPWDDDIDIAMTISDYERFVEGAERLLPDGYGIYTPLNTKNYPPLWTKVYKKGTRFVGDTMQGAGFVSGIYVDVFAYSRLDSNEEVAKRQVRNADKWQKLSYLYHSSKIKIPYNARFKPVLRAGCVVAHGLVHTFLSPESIYRNFKRALEAGNHEGNWVNMFYASWGQYPTEALFPTSTLEFDGKTYPAPHDPDSYLKITYGDYMKLPPEEERWAYPAVVLDFGDGKNAME